MLLQALFKVKELAQCSLFKLICTLLLLTACTSNQSTQNATNLDSNTATPVAKTGGTLIWARYGDADSLDPHRTTTTLSWQIFDQLYDTLLAFNDKGEIVPNLAKSWKISPDGKEATFVLNQGISCHDGTPFDANDVKYTAQRALDDKNPSVTKGAWGSIAAVDVVNPQTVRFRFKSPFGAFVSFMADPFASMVCDSNKVLGKQFGVSKAIGTGPWKLLSWTKGNEIVLAKHDKYKKFGRPVQNQGAPYLDRLIVRQIPEAQARLAGLQTGEVQLVVNPPLDDLDSVRNDDNLQMHVAQNTGQNFFFEFTISRPPFNDIRARQAVAYAVDVDSALQTAFGEGLVQREKCPISRGVAGNDQEFCSKYGYEHNPEKAKQLLAEMGYGANKPLEVILMTSTGDNREKMVQIFQSQLAQVGINAKIETMDIGTLNARVKQENQKKSGISTFDMMDWAWFDPDILYQLWHSPGAYSGYQSKELDALLEKTRTTVDQGQRKQAVNDVMEYLLKNAVHIPLYTPGSLWVYATRREVQGFKIGPFNRPVFNDVKLN
ncbi:ABC transporter substrate-binding protein [Chroococcidiopsis sp. FACHB-1243]|uniref:ABC transporter substrate-binding protein n=1 Tax=Chroococcidiopsis sp. [FACHB-1243] TaxID=2692781 RepID=UPI00177CD0A2|nr:ABC transporter substrate-binding protein [Chroococcidiopsis sp. [FACHB-1243]]MBD2304157.1 ABC transporter substrate-binding protein [Chroococcidiopsis sp. [FACHB-1243]]